MIAAAEQVLAHALGQPVRLGDVVPLTEKGRRNVVLRCRNLSGSAPSSFIIKQVVADNYDPDNTTLWDVKRFFNDWAGVAFLSTLPGSSSYSSHFYAGDPTFGFFILEDLGPHRSLVEPLLEGNAASATTAVRSYAATLGRMHAATIGQSAGFERLRQALHPSGEVSAPTIAAFSEWATRLRDGLERIDVRIDARFEQELEMVSNVIATPGPFRAYIHGDPCPDNVFFIGEQMRLIDFEFGRFDHALLDGAYGRMMFPTCWCANRLPRALVAQIESAYRAELVTGCPEAQDDQIFEAALARVCAFWALDSLNWHLAEALGEDRPWGIATIRSRLMARLEAFVTTAEEFDQLPVLRRTTNHVLGEFRNRWPETLPLPLYPAFRKEERPESESS